VRHTADGRNGRLRQGHPFLDKVVGFDGTANHDAELDRLALSKSVRFERSRPAATMSRCWASPPGPRDQPKATMHFHRDMLIIADGYAKEVLGVTPGGCVCRLAAAGLHLRARRAGGVSRCASARRPRFWNNATPPNMIEIIQTYKATVCFTAPTAYRAMLAGDGGRRGPVVLAGGGLSGRNPSGTGL
jgi:2-aminobenzoate-CoA ligase